MDRNHGLKRRGHLCINAPEFSFGPQVLPDFSVVAHPCPCCHDLTHIDKWELSTSTAF